MMKCHICGCSYNIQPKKEPWTCASCSRGNWSIEEIIRLTVMRQDGITLREIAEDLGKPYISIQRKCKKLKLKPLKRNQHRTVRCCICNKPHQFSIGYAKTVKDNYVCQTCKQGETIGRTRVDSKGYTQIKMPTHEWQMKHNVLWILFRGEIPAGKYVDFKDGDKTNITLENLELRLLKNRRIKGKLKNKKED